MSAPQFQSAEVGNVDATMVVVTFDQAVALEEGSDDKVMTATKYGEYLIPQGGLARPTGRG